MILRLPNEPRRKFGSRSQKQIIDSQASHKALSPGFFGLRVLHPRASKPSSPMVPALVAATPNSENILSKGATRIWTTYVVLQDAYMSLRDVEGTTSAPSLPITKSKPTTMGSVALPTPQANPWIETPLVESSTLSKAAGWYVHALNTTSDWD